MNNLSDLNLKDKNIIIRVDMNVPIKDGAVVDSTRISASIPTILHALDQGAKVVLVSHLGRPTGGFEDKAFSLMPVAKSLESIINIPVEILTDINSKLTFNGEHRLQMLENIRFFDGEKSNSDILGKDLSSACDIYVFDAFGTSHREQASTHSAIIQSKEACAGLLLEKEIKALSKTLNTYENPYIAIIGGAKVSTKLGLIKNINKKANSIIVGGGIANTFIKAAGHEIGQSLYEESMLDIAKDLLSEGKIILPKKVITSLSFEGKGVEEKNLSEVNENEMILDQHLSDEMYRTISLAKTILWNGPLGVFENPIFEMGTKNLSTAVAESDAYSIAGGGETITAINKYIGPDDVSYISTGGGAFLEFMEGKELPSIQALNLKI